MRRVLALLALALSALSCIAQQYPPYIFLDANLNPYPSGSGASLGSNPPYAMCYTNVTGQPLPCNFGGSGPSFTYPAGTGIVTVTGGAAWGTTVAAPAGAIVGTTDSQLLTNKTATTQTQNDNSTKLATTAYTDLAVSNAVAGVNPAVAVLAASTANVTGTYAQVGGGIGDTFTVTATGAFSLDGIAINTIGQRVLLKNQATASQNGVYTATVVGVSLVSPVFTRALDYDTPSDVNNTGAIPVQSGTVNTTTSWLLTSQVTSIGSAGSSLTYAQFSYAPASVAPILGSLPSALVTSGPGTYVTIATPTTAGQFLFCGNATITVAGTGGQAQVYVSYTGDGHAFAPVVAQTTSTTPQWLFGSGCWSFYADANVPIQGTIYFNGVTGSPTVRWSATLMRLQ